jgi:hypothetical protein
MVNNPPVHRPDRRVLRVFAFDPMRSRLSGRFLPLSIPYEADLEPGPSGELIQVIDYDSAHDTWYSPVDLDDPFLLAQDGLRPSESDPRSHQQVVYAVAMSVIERFQRFTGRRFRWHGDERLRIVPHAFEGRNAYFDPQRRAVLFGWFRADETDTEANLPGQLMFTCLSTDIVAHEVTHAIVHRVREMFTYPTNPDVYAFHEAFADLVALFHHFLFPDVVESAIAESRSRLDDAEALFSLADEFGRATGRGGPLRSALASDRSGPPDPRAFTESTEPHTRGAIFVSAVFDAFLGTYRDRIADLRRLATGGSGILGDGELSPDLVHRIAVEATTNADRLLGMVVRAFDYLPAVDVTFGDVVRAVITADRDLYPDDALRLRGRLVESLRQRGIFPPGVVSLADQALLWQAPPQPLSLAEGRAAIDLGELVRESTVKLDPSASVDGSPERSAHLYRQARSWARTHAYELGLDPEAGRIDVPGIHVAFQIAADGQPRPRIFAQFVQRREDLEKGDGVRIHAGCTVIAAVDGTVSYLIPKPLPFTQAAAAPEPTRPFVEQQDAAGTARMAAMTSWFDAVSDADPLAMWLEEPSVSRLSFAHLHDESIADSQATTDSTQEQS